MTGGSTSGRFHKVSHLEGSARSYSPWMVNRSQQLSSSTCCLAVGAVGTHGTFMDFGHMEEVKQSQCFLLNQQLLEQNIKQILVHSSKFLSERGSRTSRFVAGKGSPGEMLQTSICIHLPLGCRSATGFIWSAVRIPMELRVHRDMTGFNTGFPYPKMKCLQWNSGTSF